jgi:hypothetical protein
VIDAAFLRDSYEGRIRLIGHLGCADVADIEFRLRQLVNECLSHIISAHHNLPPRIYNNSNQYLAIKVPSQRLKDVERELDELIKWFRGGKKPRSRAWISNYAMAAMVGHPPFGKTIIAATKHQTRRIGIGRGTERYRLDRRRVYFWDILSADEAIRKAQIELYSNWRDEEGDPLYLELIPLETDWPDSFLQLVERYQRLGRVSLRDLKRALAPGDLQRMAAGTREAKHLIQFMRSSFDRKSGMTIERWARCEPGFYLINAMLDVIWPYSKGRPRTSTLGERRADGERSQRQLLGDLAQNLVDLIQEKLNQNPEFASEKYAEIRAPKHFLGEDEHYVTQVEDILLLILSLRREFVAYFVARHTIAGICEAIFLHEDDEDTIAAANCIIGPVIDKIDNRLAARRMFLGFGADHLRENAFKWCGLLAPSARHHWRGERELAGIIFPITNRDQDRHLALYGDLIRSVAPDADTLRAWTRLSAWAADPESGRKFWEVVLPEVDDNEHILG